MRADRRLARDAGEQRLDDVGAVGLRDVEPRVQDVDQVRQLGLDDVGAVELGVLVGRRRVELVLLADRDDHLVDERVAEP